MFVKREVELRSSEPNLHAITASMDGQIDQALCEINSLLHSLKDKAYGMNDQLVEQADRLNSIKEQMLDSTDYIQKQNIDLKKINWNC